MIGQLIAFTAFGLLFIFLGYLVKDRKKYNLIAGYNTMSEDEKARLVKNIVESLKQVTKEEIKLRQIRHFYKADPDYGRRVAEGLGLSVPDDVITNA